MLNNLAGATFAALSGASAQRWCERSTINNAGTFTVSAGTGLAQYSVAFNNTGSLIGYQRQPVAQRRWSGAGSASFTSTGGTLTFDGNFNLGSGTSVTAPEVDFNTPGRESRNVPGRRQLYRQQPDMGGEWFGGVDRRDGDSGLVAGRHGRGARAQTGHAGDPDRLGVHSEQCY